MVALDFYGHPLIPGDLVVYVGGWHKAELVSGTIIKVCKKQILIRRSGTKRKTKGTYKYPANVIRNQIYESNL